MLTPKFSITQTERYVIVTLHIPYVKISESEIFIEGTEFKFYLKPYYLRLNFSNEIKEDGSEHAQYDVEKGDVIVHIPKKNVGEEFSDLAMINKLLAPKKCVSKPKIEVINSDDNQMMQPSLTLPEDFSWEWDQEFPLEESSSVHVLYGFCNRYKNYYGSFVNEFPELLDLPVPDQTPIYNRKALLELNLLESFDMEHYLSDYMDMNEFVGDVIHYQPRYISNHQQFSCVDDEHQLLCQLPHYKVNAEKTELKRTLIGLVDILFAFVFDHLTNCGEISVESSWNICKISSQLSWLYTPSTLKECLLLNFSRAITFPLYRHFDFCSRVLEDLKFIVSKGRPLILKCLLGVYDVLRKHEFYYLHNNVFVKDYCLWIQSVDERHVKKLMDALNKLPVITKSDLPFPLEEFEAFIDTTDASDSSEESETSCSTELSSSQSVSGSESDDTSCSEIDIKDVGSQLVCDDEADVNMSCLSAAIENISLIKDPDDFNNPDDFNKDSKPLIEELD